MTQSSTFNLNRGLQDFIRSTYLFSRYIPDFEIPLLPPNDELDAIMGPLFLSHKYEITGLHSRLAKVLESLWPSTLAAWDKVSDRYRNEELVGELVDAGGIN